MVLMIYLLLLAVVTIILRNKNTNIKNGARVLLSFVFVLVLQIFVRALSQEEPFGNIGSSLFMTVQNITFNGDIGWANDMAQSFRAQMWFVVFIASVLTVESVLLAFFGKFISRLAFGVSGAFKKEHYIIAGDTDDACVLIEDIKRHVRHADLIFIPNLPLDGESELYRKLRVEKSEYLFRLKKSGDYHIVILPNDRLENFSLLNRLNEAYPDGKNIHITVFLDNDIIRGEDLLAENIDACVLSSEQLVVYSLFDRLSPIDILKNKNAFSDNGLPLLRKPYEICIIGSDNLCKEFLLYSFENSAFLTEKEISSFSALIIDDRCGESKEDFITDYPYFENSRQLVFAVYPVGSKAYYRAVEEHCKTLDNIFISTGSTEQNIKTAVNLCRFFDRIDFYEDRPLITVVYNESFAGINDLLKAYPNVITFDISKCVCNYNTLIKREIDSYAKVINQRYNDKSNAKTNWNKLRTFTQASNRAVVRDEYNKKALYEMCGVGQSQALDFLAKYEHARWNAFHFAHGWKVLPISELTEEERNGYVTKHPKEKRHICLVSWEKLDGLPQSQPGIIKSYDYDNVKDALKIQ